MTSMTQRLTLQQFAWASAMLDRGAPRAQVLAQLGLDGGAWQAEQAAWLTALANRAEQQHFELAQRYAAEYMQHVQEVAPRPSLATDRPVLKLAAPVAPVAQAEAAAAAAPVNPTPAQQLSLYEFAMLSAELAVFPEQSERTYAKYALGASERERETGAWRERLAGDRALRAEYEGMYRDAERHFRSFARQRR